MSTIIRSVKNLTSEPIILSHIDVVLQPNVTLDLYTLLTDDRLSQLQSELSLLVQSGAIQVMQEEDDSVVRAGGFSLAKMTTAERDATFVKASGTITIVDYTELAGKAITVNGVDLTEGVEWDAEIDNDTTATNLAAAITTATGTTEATGDATDNVVTVTANVAGTAGNSIDLAHNAGEFLLLSGDTLSGGIQPSSGWLIYNSDDEKLNIFTTAWEEVTSA